MEFFLFIITIIIGGLIFLMLKQSRNKENIFSSNNSGNLNPQDLEENHLKELEELISKGDKKNIQYWLTQNKVTSRISARAETFLNMKEWKQARIENDTFNIEIFEGRVYSEDDIKVAKQVAKQIDILLNTDLSTEEQFEKINRLQKPYKNDVEIIKGLNKHAYWHALHIIMNYPLMPEDLSKKARSERVKNMTAFNKKKLIEFPMFEVKSYVIESKIKLNSNDKGKYQFFEFINHSRDFNLTKDEK